LAVVDVTVDIAVIVVVGPHGSGKTADGGTDRSTFDRTYARNNCADRCAAGGADCRALGNPWILRARAKYGCTCKRQG
jgi:hypothetical protein